MVFYSKPTKKEEDKEAQLRRDNAFAAHCIGTLLHFGEYEPLTRFIKDRAVNPRGMRITESMLNKCMAQAVKYKITGLADACLFHEKYRNRFSHESFFSIL